MLTFNNNAKPTTLGIECAESENNYLTEPLSFVPSGLTINKSRRSKHQDGKHAPSRSFLLTDSAIIRERSKTSTYRGADGMTYSKSGAKKGAFSSVRMASSSSKGASVLLHASVEELSSPSWMTSVTAGRNRRKSTCFCMTSQTLRSSHRTLCFVGKYFWWLVLSQKLSACLFSDK